MASKHWTSANDEALKQIKNRSSKVENLNRTLSALPKENLDAFHDWRNAEFNLMFHVILEENFEAFKIMLELGSDPTIANKSGTTPLHLLMKRRVIPWANLAVKEMSPEVKKRFISQPSRVGWTPLMTAAESGNEENCAWLIEHGADPNQEMPTGWTAMHAATKRGHVQALKLLLDKGGNKHIKASHRDFGKNLELEDITTKREILDLLKDYK